MLKNRLRVNAFIVYFADIVLALVSFYLAYVIRGYFMPSFEELAPIARYQWFLLFVIPAWSISFFYTGAYRLNYRTTLLRELLRVWAAIAISSLFLSSVVFVMKSIYFSRLFLGVFIINALVLTTAERIVMSRILMTIRRNPQNVRNVIIVGTGETAEKVASKIIAHNNWGLNFLGYVREGRAAPSPAGLSRVPGRVLGTIDDMESIVRSNVVDEVIFVVSREKLENLEDIFLFLEDEGINARLVLNLFSHVIAKAHLEELEEVPLLTFTTIPTNEFALFVKRILDVVIASVSLVLLSPVFLSAAAAVRLTSRGPVVFSQKRCGLNGRVFMMHKFRSMYIDTDEMKKDLETHNEVGGPAFKMKRDPRITPVGRVLRKFSIDEFPQLWNVIKGDMSIVGPRPPIPEEVERYERWQRRRLSMKPGLTCIWQVSGRNNIRFQDWMKLDLHYIDNWSLWLDLKILFKTIPAVISGKGAY